MADLELANDSSLTSVRTSTTTAPTVGSDLRNGWPLVWGDVGALVAAGIAIAAVLVGIGKLITGPLDGSVGDIDRRVARWFADGRTSALDDLSYWGSMLAETAVKVVVTAVVAVAMIAVWKRWNDALLIALALILEASVFLTVTLLVGRHRPDVPKLDSSPVDSSFPSGHVAAAVVYGSFAIIVARHTTKRWPVVLAVAVATAASCMVAWARMYRGMHHLSDVLGGVLLGLGSIWVTWRVMNRADEGGRTPRTATVGIPESRSTGP